MSEAEEKTVPVRSDEYMEARREEILEAALACVQRSGIAGLSLSEICKEAGLSKGALYTHFPGKDEILLALVRRERERQRIDRQLRFRDAAGMRRMLYGFLGRLEANRRGASASPDLEVALASRDHAGLRRELRRTMRDRTGTIAGSIAALQARGELRRDLDAATVAALVDSVAFGMVMSSVIQTRDAARGHRRTIELLLDLLEVPAAAG